MRRSPATDSSRSPQIFSARSPSTSASAPNAADTVTWPRPQASVMRAVLPADQPRARARAANGTQWSGASECSAPTEAAATASAQNPMVIRESPARGSGDLRRTAQAAAHARRASAPRRAR